MNESITKLITERLSALERERGFRILYACESGSRAWGFASTDSDYDVRFLFVWPWQRYLGILDPPDTVELGIDENDLDISGWDLRKALRLFRKSNGSLLEWLFSPVVYREEATVMDSWRDLTPKFFLPKNSAAHYLGLSRQIWKQMNAKETSEVTAKQYLYVLRSLLACRFVVENQQPPPVHFGLLMAAIELSYAVADAIAEMVAAKSFERESDQIERYSLLDWFITQEQGRLDLLIGELPSDQGDVDRLSGFFHETLKLPKPSV